LRQRGKYIAYLKTFKPAQFERGCQDVTFGGTEHQPDIEGPGLSAASFPNFYFHAAIAHGLLRHNGVEVGKRDFSG
jgi:hypothetical protein